MKKIRAFISRFKRTVKVAVAHASARFKWPLKKVSVKFERAEIRCSQLKIVNSTGYVPDTVIELDGKPRFDVSRIEIVFDAFDPEPKITMFLVPMRVLKEAA